MNYLHQISAVTLMALSASAGAQSGDVANQKGIVSTFVRGTCAKLILAGTDMTASCDPTLVNVAYPSGGSSFMFVLAGKAMVSFFGRDTPATENHSTIYLQRVSFRDSGPDNPSSVVSGECTYTNPFAGPAVVDCDADSKDGPFKAIFTTDGGQPLVTRQ